MRADRVPNGQLCAFLDGECGRSERRRLEQALASDPSLAHRLEAWRRNDAALRVTFPATLAPGAPLAPSRYEPLAPLQAHKATRDVQRAVVTAIASFIAGALCATGALLLLGFAHGP